ncbi:carbohydrate ABC transporter permease [Cellulomonas fimi]|uniref:Binding-protein-dependent transport systems inner membrane component n=1 Tax=Cellulomonas fimi (strain ATCC 484 / DSM 20113 / JCM 1341 / CCUG 24087 / LMG 16345 / NBRC 15513 / NCIMB 8980 / NCTC 7547 / NRS-133) TaxID=590998 RepID=F4H8B2_CELFA|nr:carbohydrate ABC transporter permease [Cellulomonas fimi]AEE44669.1 binding-protein-dependent transport systems inner membrane component [Cellulomonas fimi ATCC 484]NNH07481.1 carbohydrate ABC transporter permease [Cellulomonas fimi]VEH26956.1 Inner membrane ABC transporter permease protein ycjP [Cellulomonas fimi]
MTTTSLTRPVVRVAQPLRPERRERPSVLGSAVLVVGAVYCLLPVLWVLVASSKSANELFSTFTFLPSTHLLDNVAELSGYRGGLYWRWMLNTALYAGVGGGLSVLISAMAGYALAKYPFRGKKLVFNLILAGVLVPGVVLAIPQYLLLAEINLTNTYWSVLLPSLISPYGIYLCRIYAAASVPDELLEAARTDGASEWRTFSRIAVPLMGPGLVTVFLFQFVGIWNNFMLPYIMLGNDRLYPLTVGLNGLLNQGASQPAMYTSVITGSLLSIIPLAALFLTLQRYWKVDLAAGSVKA